MMYSFNEIEALTAKIRCMASAALLGDRVAAVKVEARDHNAEIGVAIRSHEGWRHAVVGSTDSALADPNKWARAACSTLIAWLNAKAAAVAQEQSDV